MYSYTHSCLSINRLQHFCSGNTAALIYQNCFFSIEPSSTIEAFVFLPLKWYIFARSCLSIYYFGTSYSVCALFTNISPIIKPKANHTKATPSSVQNSSYYESLEAANRPIEIWSWFRLNYIIRSCLSMTFLLVCFYISSLHACSLIQQLWFSFYLKSYIVDVLWCPLLSLIIFI